MEPSSGFLAIARQHLGSRVALHLGSATALPLGPDAVDATVSGPVLNFIPDPDEALCEMQRVTKPGGTVAAYVWDYAEGMALIRLFWDVAIALDAAATPLDEATRFPLCRPEPLRNLFAAAGLTGIDVAPLEIGKRFASFEDLWEPFLGGQGPAPAYVMSLDEAERTRLRDCFRARLPTTADGAIHLTARAWAARGVVAG